MISVFMHCFYSYCDIYNNHDMSNDDYHRKYYQYRIIIVTIVSYITKYATINLVLAFSTSCFHNLQIVKTKITKAHMWRNSCKPYKTKFTTSFLVHEICLILKPTLYKIHGKCDVLVHETLTFSWTAHFPCKFHYIFMVHETYMKSFL